MLMAIERCTVYETRPAAMTFLAQLRRPLLVGLLGAIAGLTVGVAIAERGPSTASARARVAPGADLRDAGSERSTPYSASDAATASPSAPSSPWPTGRAAPRFAEPLTIGPARVGWIAVGGGVEPASNQVSMEQDIYLAKKILGRISSGIVLYAGGQGSPVIELSPEAPRDELAAALADLFDPRESRGAVYRPTRLSPNGAASRRNVVDALERALAQPTTEPLLVYVATHGEGGKTARDDSIWLWRAEPLTVQDLSHLLADAPGHRPALFVMSSCFSGGFAELALDPGATGNGSHRARACGLFASTWDAEAEGCDPDPDRRVQESYGLHFLNALGGLDRNGRPLPREQIDLDGDGRVSPLEAHARVRMASRSISVPTTSSERWLRQAAPASGPERPFAWPEEQAVIAALSRELGVRDAAAAAERQAVLESELGVADGMVRKLEQTRDDSARALGVALLERWPALDDPWREDFAATLAGARAEITAALESLPEAEAYRSASDAVLSATPGLGDLEQELALADRLVRAYENARLAARLQARGGAALDRFLALLACERSSLGPQAR